MFDVVNREKAICQSLILRRGIWMECLSWEFGLTKAMLCDPSKNIKIGHTLAIIQAALDDYKLSKMALDLSHTLSRIYLVKQFDSIVVAIYETFTGNSIHQHTHFGKIVKILFRIASAVVITR